MGWLDRHLAAGLAAGVLVVGLYQAGVLGDEPLWLLLLPWGLFAFLDTSPVQHFLIGRLPWPRAGLHFGLVAVSAVALGFLSGAGSLLTLTFSVIVVGQIDRYGAGVWRASLAWTVGAASVGQLLTLRGIVPCNVTLGVANACFVVGVVALGLLAHSYGTSRQQVEMAEARFRSLVENSHDGVLLLTQAGEITWVSASVERIMGRTSYAIRQDGWRATLHPDDAANVAEGLARLATPGAKVVRVVRGQHADGSWRWWEFTVENRLTDPAVKALVANLKDVTDSRADQERLAHAATRDSLTGLLNRSAFLDRLESALARTARKDHPAAVLFLDLDDFKSVNDQWGHRAGDVLLKTVASRLLAAVRPGDTVGRLGGDEFVVLLEDLSSAGDADMVADRIRDALRSPLVLEGRPIAPAASIGIAVSRKGQHSADELLHEADLRMYMTKQSVRRPPRLAYGAGTGGIDADTVHAGLVGREFFLEYQPVVDLATGEVYGVEALVRWNHPQRGRLGPDAFLPQVEALGLMPALGRRVLNDACHTVGSWTTEPGLATISLAVNASVSQLRDPAFPDMVRQALHDTEFPARQLVIEVTESLPVTPQDQALTTLATLSELGVRIALDDFGAGYASLAQLDLVSAHIVKLDRQLIARIETATDGFLQGLIDLLLSLHVTLIAEGIETAAQQQAVVDAGIQYGQGYHLARPCSPDTALQLLLAHTWQHPVATP